MAFLHCRGIGRLFLSWEGQSLLAEMRWPKSFNSFHTKMPIVPKQCIFCHTESQWATDAGSAGKLTCSPLSISFLVNCRPRKYLSSNQ